MVKQAKERMIFLSTSLTLWLPPFCPGNYRNKRNNGVPDTEQRSSLSKQKPPCNVDPLKRHGKCRLWPKQPIAWCSGASPSSLKESDVRALPLNEIKRLGPLSPLTIQTCVTSGQLIQASQHWEGKILLKELVNQRFPLIFPFPTSSFSHQQSSQGITRKDWVLPIKSFLLPCALALAVLVLSLSLLICASGCVLLHDSQDVLCRWDTCHTPQPQLLPKVKTLERAFIKWTHK